MNGRSRFTDQIGVKKVCISNNIQHKYFLLTYFLIKLVHEVYFTLITLSLFFTHISTFLISSHYVSTYLLDVLWGQPIKQNQVASTSELLENQQKDLFSSKSFPHIPARPQKPKKLTALKIKHENFGPKILIPQ